MLTRKDYLVEDYNKFPIKTKHIADFFQFCKINKEEYWLPYDLFVESYIEGIDVNSPYVFMNINGYFIPMNVSDLCITAKVDCIKGYDDSKVNIVRHFIKANKRLFIKHSQNKITDKQFLNGLQIAWTDENVERKFRSNDDSSWAHARIGFFDKYEVFVLADDKAEKPHIHIWDYKTKGRRFSTAVDLYSPEYSYHFCNDVFDEKGKELLMNFFEQKNEETGMNNWQYSMWIWVSQNDMDHCKKITKKGEQRLKYSKAYNIPDYRKLEAWHSSKMSQSELLFWYGYREIKNIGAPYEAYLDVYSSLAFFEVGNHYVPVNLANHRVQLVDAEFKEIRIKKDELKKLELFVKQNKYALMAYGLELFDDKQLSAYVKHHQKYQAWQIYEELAYQRGEIKYKDYCVARDIYNSIGEYINE